MSRKVTQVQQTHLTSKLQLGKLSYYYSLSNISKVTNLSKQNLYYWKKKIKTNNFHISTWGGARNCKYTIKVEAIIRVVIKNIIFNNIILSLSKLF